MNDLWDPGQYQRHSGHRTRPLLDLLARVPRLPGHPPGPRIADLGCGPGAPTRLLARRWPDAAITGYDNSPAMLAEAAAHAGPTEGGGSVDFAPADLARWTPPPASHELIVSNAALQWVPGHPERFAAWIAGLTPGGVLAFQVPGNFDAPSHTLMRDLAASPRWRDRLAGVLREPRPVLSPAGYAEALTGPGGAADADIWETTYLQRLTGEDPVLDWMLGTGLRPVLAALEDDPQARVDFLFAYRDALRTAYPAGPGGVTPYPFRRIFAVAVAP
ncbi:trans-aconitate 2-methyltransferase [Streptomyces sp. XC 2026]|uniref:trans-aconitate 2-methyltransferase n=1 Tax=Streptomyces sp. XC 2026 TaxID=2782004 RepID=UPI0019064F16|nr:trans-aconitate 2-methyltransferase [Streptomyces sp. XC 2026]QQN79103.1 trans-aconitate 2-methyltransferase [Streptomyces sp. XC 2026]